MLSSIVLHLSGDPVSGVVVHGGVELARRHGARLRGLAIMDTRRMTSLLNCESAAYAVYEHERLEKTQTKQAATHGELAQACLKSGVNFDVRSERGDPLELLPREIQFHDLAITGCPFAPTGLQTKGKVRSAIREVTQLALAGVHPLLILRPEREEIHRVLMLYDGTPASGRAIKSFLGQQLWPAAETRLVALGKSIDEARDNLREMTDYLGPKRKHFEVGVLRASLRRALTQYAIKWEADLVVMGITRQPPVLRQIYGETLSYALQRCSAALYVSG